MKLKHNDIFIPDDGTDPFVNCKLERKKYAQVLTSIVKGYADGFVLAINNPWGEGKTTFVKMWQQQLKNEGYETLYFNAWENDFEKDVLIALISELEVLKDSETEETFKTILKSAVPFAKKLLPSVAKAIANKYLGSDAVSELIGDTVEVTTEGIEEEIKAYTNRKKGIEDFRNNLSKFVKETSDDKPIVFIIDEIDRCRPDYAVEVLEQIKHLFSVSGIVFVLSIDKEQLGNAVRGVYGSDRIDAEEYLRRFIDLEYKIPKPNTQMFIEYLYDYFDFDSFINSTERLKYSDFRNDQSTLKIFAQLFYSKEEFGLRLIEKSFARIRLTTRAFTERQYLFPEIVIFINFLDIKHTKVLNNIRNRNYSLQQMTDELDKILLPFTDSTNIKRIRFLMGEFLYRYSLNYLTLYNQSNERLIKIVTNQAKIGITSKFEDDNNSLLGVIQYYDSQFDTSRLDLEFILKKYDLTENIYS